MNIMIIDKQTLKTCNNILTFLFCFDVSDIDWKMQEQVKSSSSNDV